MKEQKPITIHTVQNGREHFGEYGSCRNLLEYLSKNTPFRLTALCGGKGVCGKCRITVVSGSPSAPTTEERKLILPEALERGVRLACLTVPESDLSIRLEGEKELFGNKEDRFGTPLPVDRSIHSVVVELPPPSLDDQRSDHTRLLSSPSLKGIEFPPALLKELPKVLREGNWTVALQVLDHQVLSFHSGSKLVDAYGVAVDIGTTTVAVYLFNLNTGEHLGTLSELNAQQVFGADVISRIQFAQEGLKNLRTLQEKILMQIDSMILHLAKINNLRSTTICLATIVGNPTMIHLALGLPPENIAQAPFIP
ncbi:MAG: 2Fe-2S iron-sulfur cluster binding domain-containing protein, partial [Spirochaetales bacterium]|nr:2Fe-2S iron-sulfur cluster binding domain-containing protein [Spirochaetales bacterium]